MKLLSVVQARSLWLFQLSDLNPRGKAIERDLLKEIATRYAFTVAPDAKALVEAQANNSPLIFTDGIFDNGEERITVALMIYKDGVIADTRSSTDDSDAFITNLLTWITEEFALPAYDKIVRKKAYVGQLFVQFERSLNIINPAFEKISKFLMDKGMRVGTTPIELAVLQLWEDMPSTAQINFRLERASGTPFAENRYFSTSALSTTDHLSLLELCERELLSA